MAEAQHGGRRSWSDTPQGRGVVVATAFGAVLRRLRLASEQTQEQVAEAAGLHPTAISLLERGRRQPSLGVVIQLATVLGVRPAELVEEVVLSIPNQEG